MTQQKQKFWDTSLGFTISLLAPALAVPFGPIVLLWLIQM